jgi:hypothetical protein
VITADEAAAAERISRSRRRRRGWLRAARVALAMFIASGVWATVRWAQVGSLSTEFSVTFLGLAVVGMILYGITTSTRCPRCGRDPLPIGSGSFWLARVCLCCGLDLYSDEEHGA